MLSPESIELACGSTTHTVQLDPQTCVNEQDCNRTYHVYVPEAICDRYPDSMEKVGTLPIVFAIHCFGCNANAMMKFEEVALQFDFVLVRPEGVQSSWNAKYCCGYALDRKLDDFGFLSKIVDILDVSYDFVQKDMVFGVGWSNGGYMVTYAADLFRSVAPIAGYQYQSHGEIIENNDDNAKDINNLGINIRSPTGIFQHHSLNDHIVSFNGCCMNSTMRKCCCRISKEAGDQCTSVNQGFDDWAKTVNQCSGTHNTITFKDESRGIECRSADGCSSNTTLCTYASLGHFSNPSFSKAFPMHDQVGDFFARDACSMNDGIWSSDNKTCLCEGIEESHVEIGIDKCSGYIAQQELKHVSRDEGLFSLKSVSAGLLLVGATVLVITTFASKFLKGSIGATKKRDGWESVPMEENNEIELQQTK